MLTVREYLAFHQPHVLAVLVARYGPLHSPRPPRRYRPAVRLVADGWPSWRLWKAVMQEPPKPGLGGLLPGEHSTALVACRP
ncbi:hypothetical protein [Caldinitratiruptor microaerophilus]|uniref:Uncharacterized protein n=1 Tax=Caldinitratiruptor microaerophilus TaxID=671077 RepID=A0AA35G9J5_9FIRM|nr:hypothetical protein [Caldinitratiruptor microaerophilus]BDG61533.1 hypothetical protein caldi_26230 [Caldinitratiruptor microaerophilus]